MLNSPAGAGRDGVKAAYKMLRVLTIGNKIDFHVSRQARRRIVTADPRSSHQAVGFDKVVTRKGTDRVTGLLGGIGPRDCQNLADHRRRPHRDSSASLSASTDIREPCEWVLKVPSRTSLTPLLRQWFHIRFLGSSRLTLRAKVSSPLHSHSARRFGEGRRWPLACTEAGG